MCNCIDQMNEKLEEQDAQIARSSKFLGVADYIALSPPRIETEWIMPEKQGTTPPKVYAKFCPFCGEKYEKISIPDSN